MMGDMKFFTRMLIALLPLSLAVPMTAACVAYCIQVHTEQDTALLALWVGYAALAGIFALGSWILTVAILCGASKEAQP